MNNWPENYDRKLKAADDRIDITLQFIAEYGGIDGAHHKQWCLDQIVRILTQSTPHAEAGLYYKWVRDFEDGEEGPDSYEWDTGIAP